MTSALCVIHAARDQQQQAEPGWNICFHCSGRILSWLGDIEDWAPTLSAVPVIGNNGGRRPPGFHSTPPARLDVIAALDYRTVPTDQDPVRSILGTLHEWTRMVREDRDHNHPRRLTVSTEAAYLRAQLDWCSTQPWIDDMAEELRELHGFVRYLAGETPPRPVGLCITTTSDGDCGGSVFQATWPDDEGEPVTGARCSTCRRTYTGLDLVRLGAQQEAA